VVHLHVPATLFTGKKPPNPLNRRLGGHQSQYGHDDEEKTVYLLGITPWLSKQTNKINNYLIPWRRVILEKIRVNQLVKKFPSFYGT
jgi:hypothetical protein